VQSKSKSEKLKSTHGQLQWHLRHAQRKHTPIAGIVAASPFAMLSPVAKAQPAKFTPALTAHHVHATLVLFYGSLALGAGFGVGQNPVGILTLCTVLA